MLVTFRLPLSAVCAALFAGAGALGASADDKQPIGTGAQAAAGQATLRICAAASELPYSSRSGDGFENKIASALAEAMGRRVEFVWTDRAAIYLVHDMLDQKKCDVVMGVDTGDPRVATSKPYYRSGYVFIARKDSPLNIHGWDSPDLLSAHNVGFTPGSPAQVMMEQIGIYRENFSYMNSLSNFQDKRNRFTRVPADRMVSEVADGTADVAVNFAPEVARYVKANSNLTMIMIPDGNVRADGTPVPHRFDQSIGVRKDDTALLAEINQAIARAKPRIDALLEAEGIPLLPLSTALPGNTPSSN